MVTTEHNKNKIKNVKYYNEKVIHGAIMQDAKKHKKESWQGLTKC